MLKEIRQGIVIMRTAWVRNLNYRFTTLMFRIGEMAEVIVLIFMWTAVYAGGSATLKGFTLNEMITYVLIGNLCSVAVRNFLPSFVSRDISEGRLSMFLVKPISYIRYIFCNELGRAALAMIVSIISQCIIIAFFLDRVVLNPNPAYLVLMVAMVFLAFVIEMILGVLIGAIAFWTDEVEGLQVTIDRVKRFFAGGYFPLSLLPAALVTASTYLPFAYSFYFPAQLYLQKVSIHAGLLGLGVQLIWIVVLAITLRIVWSMGLRRYEASGS